MIELFAINVVPAITISVVIAGLVILGVIDLWRERVEDWATGALLLVAILGLGYEGIDGAQWSAAILSSIMAFCGYLWLGTRGVMGGGDVKLSIVPALVLGSVSPWLAIWWVLASNALHQVLLIAVAKITRPVAGGTYRAPIGMPHVPAMAVAMLATVLLFGVI